MQVQSHRFRFYTEQLSIYHVTKNKAGTNCQTNSQIIGTSEQIDSLVFQLLSIRSAGRKAGHSPDNQLLTRGVLPSFLFQCSSTRQIVKLHNSQLYDSALYSIPDSDCYMRLPQKLGVAFLKGGGMGTKYPRRTCEQKMTPYSSTTTGTRMGCVKRGLPFFCSSR